ncbi:MAG: patatin-like phospholipase family protein [Prevotella sp.]|uniref:patatin-like phospholipase family protein n=1 Tax=Prevotella sp. AGR2160 TaxID=1280674 RepID=UPI0003FDE628|nr:patatin-like phospholipase family protein [Prevotella sp. AGR2160]MDD5862896.1 patatin-like phospholipase family protein [Prevotella sp.]
MNILNLFKHHQREAETQPLPPSKDVALVLGGGGARGYAHIGAIHALEQAGYHITSVAGTSMGALVGGIYAAGKLKMLEEKALSLDWQKTLKLLTPKPGRNFLASGHNFLSLLDEIVGDEKIEELNVPFCCCASDVISGQEHVFHSGSLKTAIRCSVSIPCVLEPIKIGNAQYVDGSLHNTLPLNRVARHAGDKLVAINVSGNYQAEAPKDNLWSMAARCNEIMVSVNTDLSLQLTPPDLYLEMPTNLWSIFDFDKASEIIDWGFRQMFKKIHA